jgi:hypothetical protein
MATDLFSNGQIFVDSPAANAIAIPDASTTVLDVVSRAIYVGGDGDLHCLTQAGQDITFVGVVAGTILPIRITEVYNNTTATSLISLY